MTFLHRTLLAALFAALALAMPGAAHNAAAQIQGGYGGYEDYDEHGAPYDPAADDEDEYEDGQEVPDVSYFHDELEPHGRWVSHRSYGDVWVPRDPGPGWRPYTRGHWENTDEYGWYWVSDEPFGWATYHYGRWAYDDGYGWVWVPGTRWGPAWVAWRSSDEYVGWAPLPPDAYWAPRRGLEVSLSIYDEPRYAAWWSFVEPAYVVSPAVYVHCVPVDRVRVIYGRTSWRTNYVVVNRRIVNRGVSVTHIERITRTRITTRRVVATNQVSFRGADRASATAINTYRPKLTRFNAARDRRPGAAPVSLRDIDRRNVPRVPAIRQQRGLKPGFAATQGSGLNPVSRSPYKGSMLGPYQANRNGTPKRVTLPPDQYRRVNPGMTSYERARIKAQQDRAVRMKAQAQAQSIARQRAMAAGANSQRMLQQSGGNDGVGLGGGNSPRAHQPCRGPNCPNPRR